MQQAHEDDLQEDGDLPSDSGETIPTDDDEEEAPRSVLGETFLNNKHNQRINNHPSSKMAGKSSTRAAAKRKNPEDGADSDATLSADQQKDLKLQQMEMELQRLKTRQRTQGTKKKGRKTGTNSTGGATTNLVWDMSRERFFSIGKFISNDDQLVKATYWVMNQIDIDEHSGLKGGC